MLLLQVGFNKSRRMGSRLDFNRKGNLFHAAISLLESDIVWLKVITLGGTICIIYIQNNISYIERLYNNLMKAYR
jgi:hypothetical protein